MSPAFRHRGNLKIEGGDRSGDSTPGDVFRCIRHESMPVGRQSRLSWVRHLLRLRPSREGVRVTEPLQPADSAQHSAPRIPLPATLAALGIVYGDIGTSPLYAFKQAADAGGTTLSPEIITGIVSLILWSLIM